MAKIEGLDRLNRKLSGLPIVAQKRIREAMEQGAQEIVAMMKSLVPVDTGGLRDSISFAWGRAPKGAFTIAKVTQTGTENTLTIYAGDAENFQARWIEFGTAAHNITKGGGTKGGLKIIMASGGGVKHPGTAAQPFFFPAYRANKRRVNGRITRAINKAAKEVAAGGG